MKPAIHPAVLALSFALATPHALPAQADHAAPIMAGISNRGLNPTRPYVTAGDRAYLIGTQDGNFPDMGDHVPGEMGGLWLHPIKLIDGFRAEVTDLGDQPRHRRCRAAREFITYPYGNRFRYGPVLDSLESSAFSSAPTAGTGVIVQYIFRNAAARTRQLSFELPSRPTSAPSGSPSTSASRDARDTVAWQPPANGSSSPATPAIPGSASGARRRSAGARSRRPSRPRSPRSGMGVTAASRYRLSVGPPARATLTFVHRRLGDERAWSARRLCRIWPEHHASLLARKQARYAALIDRARIRIPDRRLQQVYDWVRVNMEWLGQGRSRHRPRPRRRR